jgi:hypothetical protein
MSEWHGMNAINGITHIWTHEINENDPQEIEYQGPDPYFPANGVDSNTTGENRDESEEPFADQSCSGTDMSVFEWCNL